MKIKKYIILACLRILLRIQSFAFSLEYSLDSFSTLLEIQPEQPMDSQKDFDYLNVPNYRLNPIYNFYYNQTSPFDVTLNWSLNDSNIFCSLNSFSIAENIRSSTTSIRYSSKIVAINQTDAYRSQCLSKVSISSSSSLNCFFTNLNTYNCSWAKQNLMPNSLYSFWIQAISSDNVVYNTSNVISIPSGSKKPIVFPSLSSSLRNSIGMQIILPPIDQTDGSIAEMYLFLVNLGTSYSMNFTLTTDLNTLLSNSASCSSSSKILEACLLARYNMNTLELTKNMTLVITITNAATQNLMKTMDFMSIQNPIIQENSWFQTFFVYKVKNVFDPSELNSQLYSSEVIPPIKITAYSSSTTTSSNPTIQDWTIILICVIVVIISILIIGLVVACVCRKRIKKLCRRCCNKYKPNIELVDNYYFYGKDSSIKSPENIYEFRIADIKRVCAAKRNNDNFLFEQEFNSLPDYANVKSSNAANDKKNAIKNRYTDIKAYDESRVVLKSEGEDTNEQFSDYINANFVQGYSNPCKFIATQGPKSETVEDFWKMIEQYNCSFIIMLTDLVEKNVIKCQKYWPNSLNTTETYSNYSVTFLDERVFVDYVKRTFKLINIRKKDEAHPEAKIITQYFYPSWADKFTPNSDLISIFNLIRDVNLNYKYENKDEKLPPIVVHCSAGKKDFLTINL